MSEIEKLIQELCPDGVPFKKLGEIGSFYSGLSGKNKEDFKAGNSKYITYMNVYSNPAVSLDISDFVDVNLNENQNSIQKGDILFTASSETPDECGMSSVVDVDIKENIYLNSFCFGFRLIDISKFNTGFLKHLFRSPKVRKQIARTANGVTRFNVSKKLFAELEIPVPPLAVQNKIVEILDNFTSLTAELEAELEARKRQYEYYRNLLLTFNPVANGAVTGGEQQIGDGFTPPIKSLNIRYLSLGEMGTFIRGKYLQKKDFVDNGYPCIHYGQLYTYYGTSADKTISFVSQEVAEKSSIASKNDLLITLTSENEDDVCKPLAWLGEEDIAVSGHMVIYKHNQNPKYLSYLLQSEQFFIDKRKIAHGTKVIEVKPDNLAKIVVPIPPLDEQERIVAILDSFETLVNDLTAGLPAEIESRRKQYEYYRNKLLTFKKIA
ncbi:MAG: restriction endonuclease subunit S [Muribaculaceae bacterium]|nr:restriction endonuclease subunit S [Muribaculaceae bacterium]